MRWEGRFHLPDLAELTLVARATDGTGALQIGGVQLAAARWRQWLA